jgi:hypothetical protein
MKSEGGLWATAAVLGIAATVGISSNQTKPSTDATGQSKIVKSSLHNPSPTSKPIENGPCPDIEKLLQTFFLVPEGEVVAPESCYPDQKPPLDSPVLLKKATRLRFVIATLPDPLHTHFSLSFDRSIEAVQEAAQDEQYIYNSSWLPWNTEQPSYALLDDQDKADKRKERQEDQPGFLLFRGRLTDHSPFEDGLLVLVVGEEPTGGIHRKQFENAVQWIKALQPKASDSPTVQILGPIFSGSLPSLVELLKDPSSSLAERVHQHLRIYSGGVTSNAGVDWLDYQAMQAPLKPLGIEFRSFEHSGNLDLDRYCRYVSAVGTDLARLAIVSEDETAFGGEYGSGSADSSPCRPKSPDAKPHQGPDNEDQPSQSPGNKGPVHLYYPRDISALRAAYQNQSIFTRAMQGNTDSPRRTLQSDLADPEGKDHDTVRAYSGNQSALSQEAELQQLVSLMRAHNSQYLLLRSSNPLDQLFLSHFFRMTYPQGRIVIVGADLLLRRETGASGLNGVMTLSTYPLLPWEQDWTLNSTPGKFHYHRVFTNDGTEGIYVAERFLLRQLPVTAPNTLSAAAKDEGEGKPQSNFVPPNCIREFILPDYAPPFWMNKRSACNRPPTWLSVLGNGGFWPVAVLDFPTCVGCRNPPRIPVLGETETPSDRLWHSMTSSLAGMAFLFGINPGSASAGGAAQSLLPMPPSMKFLMFGGLFWATFHAFCCSRASITVKPAHRAHFVRPNCAQATDPHTKPEVPFDCPFIRRQQGAHRALVLFGSILVALLPITLAWGCGEMWKDGEPLPNHWAYHTLLALTWSVAGIAVCANTWIEDFLFSQNDRPPVEQGLGQQITAMAQGLRTWARKMTVPEEVWRSLFSFVLISMILYWCLDLALDRALNDANRIPTYWRAINLTTGVSPLVPLVALIAGLYGWFWYSLQGLALFGEDRPRLPKADCLKVIPPAYQDKPAQSDTKPRSVFDMLSREKAGNTLEMLSSPFDPSVWTVAVLCFAGTMGVACWVFGCPPIRNLGSRAYSFVFCFWLFLCISILLANTWQLARVWLRLRHMLQFLDRLPLRRTLAALAVFSWGSVWKMGGNVLDMRYKLIFRQLESWTHLYASLQEIEEQRSSCLTRLLFGVKKSEIDPNVTRKCFDAIRNTSDQRVLFAEWQSIHWDNWKARRPAGLKSLQHSLADMAGIMLPSLLIPAWRKESESLAAGPTSGADESGKDKPEPRAVSNLAPHVRNAEELVCLVYIAFIQNILGRIRSLVMGIICIFLAITVAVSCYPFDPRPLLSGIVVTVFIVLGLTIVLVYSQMHRDATLSNLTGTKPGELGSEFWLKLVGFGAGPVLGLLASVFPEFTDTIFSWVQPGIASIK